MSSPSHHHSNGRSRPEREQLDANRIAVHVAERIERAQDMLGRLGRRDVYEPNYTTEKLADAARCCVDALALLGDTQADVEQLTTRAWDSGHTRLQALRCNARQRVEMADGLACVRCGERGGAMRVAGTVADDPRRQVFEHADCRQDGLALQIAIDAPDV
jgi:hypothetical protein